MDYQSFKSLVVKNCAELGVTDYELYYQAGESTSVSAFLHEVNEFTGSREGGICFRCIHAGRMGYASTEALTEEEALAVVKRAMDNASVLETDDPVFLSEGGKTYQSIDREGYPLPSTEELVAKVLCVQEELYGADPAVIDGSSTQVIAEKSILAICNSRGLDLQYENALTGLVVAAVVKGEQEMANDYQIKLGDLSKLDTAAITKKAAAGALAKLGGEPAPTGQYPVVFDSEAMTSLLSTFSSIFSSEAAQKGLSKLSDKEGAVIASELLTIVDDPFHKDNPMPMPFDAEGSPTFCKKILEGGKLNTLLYNMKTAAKAGKSTTGNAAKAGYAASVGVRPFTMYIAPGELTEEELLQKAGNGVYINSLGGLHAGANPISGDFSLQSAGFLIEDGKKTQHVKSFTVAGNFYELLKNITAIADNTELPMAMGSTAFGAPSVLVEGLSIAGK